MNAVRDSAMRVAKSDPTKVPAIVDLFEGHSEIIFDRLGIYLLSQFSQAAPNLVTARLTDRRRFEAPALHHEYYLLADRGFGGLSEDDQATILGWIEAGPSRERLAARWKEAQDVDLTDEEVRRWVGEWQLKRLTPLSGSLPSAWTRRYAQLQAEFGQPEHPTFLSYSVEWVVPTSPKSVDELRAMSIDEVVALLGTWQPSGEWRSPTVDGLASVLRRVVVADPECFAERADDFRVVELVYVEALLSGLREAVEQGHSYNWESVLQACRWVEAEADLVPDGDAAPMGRNHTWAEVRKAAVDLLGKGLASGSTEIPFALRAAAWDALQPLTADSDPTLEDEARYGGSNMDPLTLALNTTRGAAMRAVVAYALWVRRHLESVSKERGGETSSFALMPEVQEVLDLHLDPNQDPALAIHAVYGEFFPHLAALDRAWVARNVARIFPVEQHLADLRDSAWEAYLTYSRLYDDVVVLLWEEYRRAIERIGASARDQRRAVDPDGHLAEHLMILYWHGQLDLDDADGLLARFYAKASSKLSAHASDFLGRSLHHTEGALAADTVDRLRQLWDRRLEAVLKKPAAELAVKELGSFGWWFASGKLPDEWALRQVEKVLRLVHTVDSADLVVERLAKLADAMPMEAVQCLKLLIEGDMKGWHLSSWLSAARGIVEAALHGPNDGTRELAVDVVHLLGARGYPQLRDLLLLATSAERSSPKARRNQPVSLE